MPDQNQKVSETQAQDGFLEALQAEFDEIEQQVREAGISVPDELLIHTYLRGLARRADEIERVKAFALKVVGQLQRQIVSITAWRGPQVEAAVARNIAHKKKRSIDTPWGRVGFRRSGKATVIFDSHDIQGLVIWCQEHCPQVLMTSIPAPTTNVKKLDLAEFLKDSGLTCPFVSVQEAGMDKFYADTRRKEGNE